MRSLRAYAILATLLTLGACHVYPFRYVELSGENIEVTKTGDPSTRRDGEPIPIEYSVMDPAVSLTIIVTNEVYNPSLDIVSSLPIRTVTFGTTRALSTRISLQTCVNKFHCRVSLQNDKPGFADVGDVVRLTIELEDRVDPISITGAVAESGHFVDPVIDL